MKWFIWLIIGALIIWQVYAAMQNKPNVFTWAKSKLMPMAPAPAAA